MTSSCIGGLVYGGVYATLGLYLMLDYLSCFFSLCHDSLKFKSCTKNYVNTTRQRYTFSRYNDHYSEVTLESWRHKSPTTRLFPISFFRITTNKNTKTPHYFVRRIDFTLSMKHAWIHVLDINRGVTHVNLRIHFTGPISTVSRFGWAS